MSKRVAAKGVKPPESSRQRLLAYAVVLAAVAFALFGGEYTTPDWLSLRRQVHDEKDRVAELTHAVDSLDLAVKLLEKDAREQERVAREAFGMIKDGEHLYRILPKE